MGSMVADRPRRQPEPSIAERAAHYEATGGQPERAAPTAIPPLEGRAAASKAGRKAPGSAWVDVEVPLHRGRQASGTNVTSIPYANSPVAASCFARCPKGSDFSAKMRRTIAARRATFIIPSGNTIRKKSQQQPRH
jgi:hypothetical protein